MDRLQVLVATMRQKNVLDLYKRMNLSTDALVINQSDSFGFESLEMNSHRVEFYTFNERGLARSRNNALMRATGEFICLADDDMKYTDTYSQDIVSEFDKHPEADAIVFNVDLINGNRQAYKINKFARVGKSESRQYGSVHIVMRREKILYSNLFFNIMFGSGAFYNCGEDTLFLKRFLDSGLKLYKSPIKIGEVDMSESSWFKGYDDKYFFDKGAVIAAAYPKIGKLLIIIQSIRNSKSKLGTYKKAAWVYQCYNLGFLDYKNKI